MKCNLESKYFQIIFLNQGFSPHNCFSVKSLSFGKSIINMKQSKVKKKKTVNNM